MVWRVACTRRLCRKRLADAQIVVVDDLLDLRRMEDGQSDLSPSTYDMHALIDEMVRSSKAMLDPYDVRVDVQWDGKSNKSLLGDAAMIVGDTGRVVPPDNPDALAAAWGEILSMDAPERERLGQAARARVEANFEIGQVVARYEDLYREVSAYVRD